MSRALQDLNAACTRFKSITARQRASAAAALANPELIVENEIVRSSLTVALSGTLEAFLRQCAKEYCAILGQHRLPFASLPTAMQKALLHEGGTLASNVARDSGHLRWVQAAPEDLYARLASVNGGEVDIVWEVFPKTNANPDYVVFKDFLRRLDVPKPSLHLQETIGPTHSIVSTALKTLMVKRNGFAHQGAIPDTPSEDELDTYCDHSEALAKAVVRILRWRARQPPFALDVNAASLQELERVPGLGPTLSSRVLAEKSNGAFRLVDELVRVEGISTKRAASLAQYLCTGCNGATRGQTEAQIESVWGTPADKSLRHDEQGRQLEDWHYGTLETKRLTFRDGILSKCQYGKVPASL